MVTQEKWLLTDIISNHISRLNLFQKGMSELLAKWCSVVSLTFRNGIVLLVPTSIWEDAFSFPPRCRSSKQVCQNLFNLCENKNHVTDYSLKVMSNIHIFSYFLNLTFKISRLFHLPNSTGPQSVCKSAACIGSRNEYMNSVSRADFLYGLKIYSRILVRLC